MHIVLTFDPDSFGNSNGEGLGHFQNRKIEVPNKALDVQVSGSESAPTIVSQTPPSFIPMAFSKWEMPPATVHGVGSTFPPWSSTLVAVWQMSTLHLWFQGLLLFELEMSEALKIDL